MNFTGEKYNLLYTCRTCTKDLQGERRYGLRDLLLSNNISGKIFELLDILELKICPNDGLPQQICNECKDFLIKLYSFRSYCEKSQVVLNDYFRKLLTRSSPKIPRNQLFNIKYNKLIRVLQETDKERPDVIPTIRIVNNDRIIKSDPFSGLEFGANNVNISFAQHDFDLNHEFVRNAVQIKGDVQNHDVNSNDDISQDINQENKEILIKSYEIEPTRQSPIDYLDDYTDFNAIDPIYVNVDDDKLNKECTITNKINKNNNFRCSKCNRYYSDRSLLKAHQIDGVCSNIDNEYDDLKVLEQSKDKPYLCRICNKGFKTAGVRNRHTQLTHSDPGVNFECDICHHCFKNKAYLSRHIRLVHVESEYPCPLCELKFSTKNKYIAHFQKHKSNKKFQCEYCDKSFSQLNKFNDHHRTHTNIKPYLCTQCGKRSKTLRVHKVHELIHTGETPFTCNICGKGFIDRWPLKLHLERHKRGLFKRSGDKPTYQHRCLNCNRTFKLPSSLASHMNKCTDSDQKFKCSECGHAFKRRERLRAHIDVVHLNKKPYACEYCDKRFSRPHERKIHMKYHTGEERIKCDSCEKTFIDNGALRRHERIHTGERPYKCEICSTSFIRYSSFSWHYLKHFRNKKTEVKDD